MKKFGINIFKNKEKTYAEWKAKGYVEQPIISFVIQSHNRSENVLKIVETLRSYVNYEIIVIDDGSEPHHSKKMIKNLVGGNEFVLRFNDLYEVITYDRAIYFAKGKYIILLQDDDDFDNLEWVDTGINIFDKDEKLVILGGRDGAKLLPYDKTTDGVRGEFVVDNNIAYRKNSFKLFLESLDNHDYKYVQYVDRAPMWIHRELFIRELKGINIMYAPFQWDDADLSLRAWLSGLHVAYYHTGFKIGGLGLGGMQLWNKELHHRQDEVNVRRLYEEYGDRLPEIDSMVENANSNLR